jgi:hypothetical protein
MTGVRGFEPPNVSLTKCLAHQQNLAALRKLFEARSEIAFCEFESYMPSQAVVSCGHAAALRHLPISPGSQQAFSSNPTPFALPIGFAVRSLALPANPSQYCHYAILISAPDSCGSEA